MSPFVWIVAAALIAVVAAGATFLVVSSRDDDGGEEAAPATTAEPKDRITTTEGRSTTTTRPSTTTTTTRPQTTTTAVAANPIASLPAGLFCRDLADRGYSTVQAIDYYMTWSQPERMDADGNGVPCETVYPDAAAVWAARGGG